MSAEPTPTPTAELATTSPPADISRLLIRGDLSVLGDDEKARYFLAVCQATGLNPAARPFEFIKTKNGLKLYANKAASDQLRKRDQVSLRVTAQHEAAGLYVVTVEASLPSGRVDTDVGVTALGSLTGEDRANAIMKAVTKAKRRVTLSICGLGMLDESEVDALPDGPRQVDATPSLPAPPPLPPPVADALEPSFATRIDAAGSEDVLKHIGTQIAEEGKKGGLSAEAQARLKSKYAARLAVVRQAAAQAVVPPPPPPAFFDPKRHADEITDMVAAIKMKDFEGNLNKAYGKTSLAALDEAELKDLHARLRKLLPPAKAGA